MLDFHGFCFAFSDIVSSRYTGVDLPHLKAIYDKIIANPNYAKESVDEHALFIIRSYENAVDAIVTLTNRIHADKRVLDILTKMFDWLRAHSQCMFDDETLQEDVSQGRILPRHGSQPFGRLRRPATHVSLRDAGKEVECSGPE